MKVEEYNVIANADYFSYQSSRKQSGIQEEVKESNASKSGLKGDESIKSNGIADTASILEMDEKVLIKDLSASLLKGIKQSVEIGNNLGFSTVRSEAEALIFETIATVKTDNRKIEFNLNVSLS
ncbi:hypothetical protein, partial [Sulfuricurvum sp.]|uniref:hypothetical protein n=1 Tax=Sulfuricurvum sp. TaxID=2025608 RepID=UPI003BB81488